MNNGLYVRRHTKIKVFYYTGILPLTNGNLKNSYHLTPASNRCLFYATFVFRTPFIWYQFQSLPPYCIHHPSLITSQLTRIL